MALIEYDLEGKKRDKVELAIKRIKNFEPEEGYYLACSFGKDSMTVLYLMRMAGVKFDAHYNGTTVDPPELVRFGTSQFDTVIYEYEDGRKKYFTTHGKGGRLLSSISENEVTGDVIYFTIPKLNMKKLIVKNLCRQRDSRAIAARS